MHWFAFIAFTLWASGELRAQVGAVVYDDMCQGCCGLRLTLHSDGKLEYVSNGVARFDGYGEWLQSSDSVVVKYDYSDRTQKFIFRDSLTLVKIDSEHSLPLLKTEVYEVDSSRTVFQYGPNRLLSSTSTYHFGRLVRTQLFEKHGMCEMLYGQSGTIIQKGCWRKGQPIDTWLYFKEDGELLRVEKH